MLVWSERRGPRLREMVADAATIAWVGLWALLGIRLYGGLAELAGAGRLIRDGGIGLRNTGGEVAGAVEGIPLVGENAAAGIRDAFGTAADPVIAFGLDIERLLLIIAGLLGLMVVLIAVVPWLQRYLPWRLARVERLNAAARVIRPAADSPRLGAGELNRLLASRALHRLEYAKLLEFTPDPFGDWAAGRLDGLVQAELASTGLRVPSLESA
ncbi:MAG TPA: hypothetical protein VLA59_00595 [Patescibacteria group bacterium]|nr:hypothetical protein [Patescibacteria group bacterium]